MMLKTKLEAMPNAGRANRDRLAGFVLQNPGIFHELIRLVFSQQGKLAVKAAWVFELVVFQEAELLDPHLDFLSGNLHSLSDESALRPISKVINLLVKTDAYAPKLKHSHKKAFVEACFDWLIETRKTATQVFAMDTLYRLGSEPTFKWVHPELRHILSRNLTKGTPGYQNRALKILAKL